MIVSVPYTRCTVSPDAAIPAPQTSLPVEVMGCSVPQGGVVPTNRARSNACIPWQSLDAPQTAQKKFLSRLRGLASRYGMAIVTVFLFVAIAEDAPPVRYVGNPLLTHGPTG